jgi:hypothetical protein
MGLVSFGALFVLMVGKISMVVLYYNNNLSLTLLKLRIFGFLADFFLENENPTTANKILETHIIIYMANIL